MLPSYLYLGWAGDLISWLEWLEERREDRRNSDGKWVSEGRLL